ncbi:PDZ domain-containing protein [Myxococcaceae bacterium JPH2]|nr:PDZ domain-containing protein [Myxococcaceae bacterium JPH2]
MLLLWLRMPPPGSSSLRPHVTSTLDPNARGASPVHDETQRLEPTAPETRRAAPGTVGAGFREEQGRVAIAWLIPDGPADRAGAHIGAWLLAVDGQEVRDAQEAEARTFGPPGTSVRLQVRDDSGAEREVRVSRAD